MQGRLKTKSEIIHDRLDHPVIDVDGHNIDFGPLILDYIREFAGAKGVERYRSIDAWYTSDDETRRRYRLYKPRGGLASSKDSIDHITAIVPALMEERLVEMGLDYSVILPSPLRVGVPHMEDDEMRQPLCRAINSYQADLFRPHAYHLTPAAVIPMYNPTEAIEELDYAVNTLGMKTTQMASFVPRALPFRDASVGRTGWDFPSTNTWWDTLALDSEFDYDPVWAKCQELKVAPAFHSGTMGLGARTMYSNAVYNHIGHFADGCVPICKALFLGGVTNRFPNLKFEFLEGGVAWAASLYCDLIGHWKTSWNPAATANLGPKNIDFSVARDLFLEYGNEAIRAKADEIDALKDRWGWGGKDHVLDNEYAAAGVKKVEDIRDRFIPNFFFGCEADDPMNRTAFDKKLLPLGAELNAVFGSDIGHPDVPDMTEVLEEAYELVEHERITSENFRSFVFENPIKLHAGMNPDFYVGTAVEKAVDDELARMSSSALNK